MNITVERETMDSLFGTFGKMSLDGAFFCYTLEPSPGPELIPPGTYQWCIELSPKFQKMTPHLQNVPGHSYEEIHVGNYVWQTLGCCLVGLGKGEKMITGSQMAFTSLMEKLPQEGSITYINPQETAT